MFPFHGSTGHRKVRTGSSGVPPAEPELRPGMAERCSRRTGKGAGGCTPSGGGRIRAGGMDVSVSAISRSRTRKRREPSLVSLSSRVAAASSTARHAAGGGRTGSSGEADAAEQAVAEQSGEAGLFSRHTAGEFLQFDVLLFLKPGQKQRALAFSLSCGSRRRVGAWEGVPPIFSRASSPCSAG